jgi:hypothetical protein
MVPDVPVIISKRLGINIISVMSNCIDKTDGTVEFCGVPVKYPVLVS